jgi:hypothetical protein
MIFSDHKLGCRQIKPTDIQAKLPIRNNHLFQGVKSKLVAAVASSIEAVAPHLRNHSNFFIILNLFYQFVGCG